MNDTAFTAMLKTGKLTARADEAKTIRRVQFSLVRDFDEADAEWLGPNAIQLRSSLKNRTLNRFEIPIDAYHAKASLHAEGGNVEVDVDGITATAAIVGADDKEREEITYLFEAFPDAKLLTFLASSLREHIDCELVRSQTEMDFHAAKDKPAEKPKGKPGKRQNLTLKLGDKAGGQHDTGERTS